MGIRPQFDRPGGRIRSMKKYFIYIAILMIAGCVEPYNFKVKQDYQSMVIEAFLSDKSFNETLAYPSDGRYFSVKLTYSGDVANERPSPVAGAIVELADDQGSVWTYQESSQGLYLLADNDFKAVPGRDYRLTVTSGGDVYQSEWERLPTVETPPMAPVTFVETEKDVFVMEANEWVVRTKKGIEPIVSIPPNTSGQDIYYRWEFEPTWMWAAPLVARLSPTGVCWVRGHPWELNQYELQIDKVGGYTKPMFFMATVRNDKFFERFSLLVKQYSVRENYYYFGREMKERVGGVGINEVPPYNLKTNYTSANPDKQVFGYFSVVQEQARRWFFDRSDLSYTVVNTAKADCEVSYGGPPAPQCFNCLAYEDGIPTTQRPWWWED